MPSSTRHTHTASLLCFLLSLALALSACGGQRSLQEGAPVPTQVEWKGGTLHFDALEEKVQASVVVKDQTGKEMRRSAIRWLSRDPLVVEVDEEGVIVSKGNGSTIVEATAGEAQALLPVHVRQLPTRVEVEPEIVVLRDIGERAPLFALALDRNGHAVLDAAFVWRSVDPAVASVDGSGKVTARAQGETIVLGRLEDSELSATARVLVEPAPASLRILLKFPGLVAGAAGEAQVEVLDSAGQRIPSVSEEIHVSLSRNPAAAKLGGVLAVRPTEGLAVFPDLSIDKAGEGYILAAKMLDLVEESAPFDVFACAPGLEACPGGCVDTGSDTRHCGACGTPCGEGMVCDAGACRCGAGLTRCGDRCVDLQADEAHCGGCDQPCDGTKRCEQGVCACPDLEENCGGECVDLESDARHCGACGSPCAWGVACVSGACDEPCPPGQALCNQVCVDIWSSTQHCGGCNRTCNLPTLCSQGRCMPDPQYANWPIPPDKPGDYRFPATGVVLDPITRLMWEREASSDRLSFTEASARCKNLRLGAFSDWRLPTRIELISILDDTRRDPAIDETAFPGTPPETHWSASNGIATGVNHAFQVDFFDGSTSVREASEPAAVRCVRFDASYPEESELPLRYTVEDTTVTAKRTGLRWQRSTEGLTPASYLDAAAACAAADGRLPRRKELESLVNVRRRPGWPEELGKGPTGWHWTSTAHPAAPTLAAWGVEFHDGASGPVEHADEAEAQVRCLHDPSEE